MNIREISVARLKEYENNPRNNDLAVEKVKYSIGPTEWPSLANPAANMPAIR